ncbi:oligosaccharide flippase family protein, partial [Glaesserella parasuis]|nr:oligosaccharide flippase family protein [Glaesserella parasuis]
MTIIKQGIIYLIGEILSKSIPFLMLPYFTRTLGSEGYGEISIYQTAILLMVIFISLSQEGAISRYYFRYGKLSLGNLFLAGTLYNSIITFLIIIVILYTELSIPIELVLIASLQSLISVQLAINQCQKKAFRYLIIQILNATVVNFLILFLFEKLGNSTIDGWIDANLYGYIFMAFISIVFNKKLLAIKKFHIKTIRLYLIYLFSFGIPIIIHQISSFIRGHFDKILIAERFNMEMLGEYSIALQIASVISVAYMALNKAMLPYYFEWLKKEKENVKKIKCGAVKLLGCFIIPVFINFIPYNVYNLSLIHISEPTRLD